MNHKAYLETHLGSFIEANTNKQHWRSYIFIILKRFSLQTLMVLIFQYLVITNLTFSLPVSPMYPPIGIAFVMFYLLGNNALLGLLLGGLLGYLIKGFVLQSALLYLTADIGASYLGSLLCQKIFTSDIRSFAKLSEMFEFLKINAFITCFFSALARIGAIFLKVELTFYDCLNLWISDLNGIVVLSGFLLSWAYVPFSREKISERPTMILAASILVFTLFSVFFMKKTVLLYVIAAAMTGSISISYYYGYLVATGLLFVISAIYLSHMIALKQLYMRFLGTEGYTVIPILLFIFSVAVLYVGHLRQRLKDSPA